MAPSPTSLLDIETRKAYDRTMSTHQDPDPRMEEQFPTDDYIERLEASDPANERPEEYWLPAEGQEVDWHNRCWPCHGFSS